MAFTEKLIFIFFFFCQGKLRHQKLRWVLRERRGGEERKGGGGGGEGIALVSLFVWLCFALFCSDVRRMFFSLRVSDGIVPFLCSLPVAYY